MDNTEVDSKNISLSLYKVFKDEDFSMGRSMGLLLYKTLLEEMIDKTKTQCGSFWIA